MSSLNSCCWPVEKQKSYDLNLFDVTFANSMVITFSVASHDLYCIFVLPVTLTNHLSLNVAVIVLEAKGVYTYIHLLHAVVFPINIKFTYCIWAKFSDTESRFSGVRILITYQFYEQLHVLSITLYT